MRVLVVVVAVLLAVAAAGCGGGGQAAVPTSTDPLQLAQDANEFADARADLANCAGEQPDPSVDAKGAATTLIRIARLHPDTEYLNGASYREIISYEAAHANACDPAIADQLESGLDSLP